MNEFIAKNPKQLDICLKLLYAEHIFFSVRIQETNAKKIEYRISANADAQTIERLMEKYRILTS